MSEGLIERLLERREQLVHDIEDEQRELEDMANDAVADLAYAELVKGDGKQRRYFELTQELVAYFNSPFGQSVWSEELNFADPIEVAIANGTVKVGDRFELPPFDPLEAIADAKGLQAETDAKTAAIEQMHKEIGRIDEQIVAIAKMGA